MLDSLVRLTYSHLPRRGESPHILINAAPDALPEDTLKAFNQIMELKARFKAGENFGNLASTYSEDPSARVNKGNLGYFTALQMVYPFETAAYNGNPGEVVGFTCAHTFWLSFGLC